MGARSAAVQVQLFLISPSLWCPTFLDWLRFKKILERRCFSYPGYTHSVEAAALGCW